MLLSLFITEKIIRVLDALCQELGMKTNYIFLIILQHYAPPPGLWTHISYSKMLIKVKRYWHITRIHLVINNYPVHHHMV